MKKINLNNLEIYEPRLDWLSVIGDIPHLDRDNPETLNAMKTFFEQIGFHKMSKRDRPTFRTNIYGMEVSFGKRKRSTTGFIKVEFQGQFFADSMPNCEAKIKMFLDKFWKAFGVMTPPKVTRIDISTDIKDVSHKDIFPDFADGRYCVVTNNQHKPKFYHSKHYSNEDDPTEETGISVNNSRFEFALYERVIKLENYAKTPHKMWYVNYYRDLYGDCARVLRIETRLKKELCSYFNIAFFLDKRPLVEVLIKSLAHFNHHHRIYDTEKECFLEDIDRLFYRKDYESIKTLKLTNNLETDLEILHFNNPYSNTNPSEKHIARVLIANDRTSNQDIVDVMKRIKTKIYKEVEDIKVRLDEQKKTHKLFQFDEKQQEIYAQKFIEFSHKLERMQEENPEKVDSLLDYLKLQPFIKEIEEFEPEGFEQFKPFLDISN